MKKKIIIILPLLLIIGFSLFLYPSLANAQTPECKDVMTKLTTNCRIVPVCGDKGCDLCAFFSLVVNIFAFIAFRLAPPVAGLLIVFAGAIFLTSGGSEERVTQAKKIFINVVIGLIFVFASWLIVNSIIQVIGKSVGDFNPQSWWKFTCSG
ncbi:MAG: hypothetical protein A2Y98_00605 [Candidatus Portnoybacteria bacterium RBG_19FT_COMBO_36_7]|uniref:Uncharacterized protein n=1 Tax=Candidatus Portnoybacteria bacterium RBG_19FT_COMBO_36_7 TaxID=1801992 RepID=A0A1G2F8T6_9BACT|nr:MAG: hypothetical protein A2Y98_00605 [Candidatus Portnoybacteria bacterium RBG_19FT_COMBO_36_7]